MPLRQNRIPSFWVKAVLAAGLAGLANLLLYAGQPGSVRGAWALALLAAAAATNPALARDRRAMIALGVALVFALVQLEAPSLLSRLLFTGALFVGLLSPRAAGGDDAWIWARRLTGLPMVAAWGPVRDGLLVARLQKRRTGFRPLALVRMLSLPVIGGAIFLALFAVANPVLAQVLGQFRLPPIDAARTLFSGIVAAMAWLVMRPRRLRRPGRRFAPQIALGRFEPSPQALILSLAVFNGIFALQNGLDIAFLWGGATLPEGVTLAAYAHRGAYTLIFTALLAGLFVLAALRPGSTAASISTVRILLLAWVGQNVFLVASSILRTVDYVAVYSLTPLRIAALAWMGLVAIGLILICWRMMREKSSSWLINANALMAGLVLCLCTVVDLRAVTAAWNVDHAAEVGGAGAALDVCYLGQLGDAALVPLARLERRPLPASLAPRVSWTRNQVQTRLAGRQAAWRSWTWRGMRRLHRAEAMAPPRVPAGTSSCEPMAPPAPPTGAAPRSPPLTAPLSR